MKKLILIATGFVFLAGGSFFLNATHGQSNDDMPHRVGLIDIGYVFSKYEKLKYLQLEMNAEVQAERDKMSAKVKKIKELQEELKTFNDGTPEYTTRDARVTKMISELETENKVLTHTFQQKQAKMLHTVYLEVQDAVEKMCKHYKFTVIIQFSRTDMSSTDPKRVNQAINQNIVYHRKRDDLTDGVLKYLNDRYVAPTADEEKSAAPPATSKSKKDSNIKPAGGVK